MSDLKPAAIGSVWAVDTHSVVQEFAIGDFGWMPIYRLGNYNSIATVRDIPEIKFDLNDYEVHYVTD